MLPPLELPIPPPEYRDVRLRAFRGADTDMLHNMSTDPYVPLTGTLPGWAAEA